MTADAPRVAVTGANGYAGSRIVRGLSERGLAVRELVRRPAGPSARAFALGEPVAREALAGAETLVHCAYDFDAARWADIRRVNIEGSLRLFDAARDAGVRRILLISTLSAFPGCASMYGRAKLEIERGAGPGAAVVRPGLIHDDAGPGGMVGALGKLARALPIVPMVGRGRQILHACHSEDLAALVAALCRVADAPRAPVAAACPAGWEFRAILLAMAAAKGRRPLLVPCPARLLWAGLKTAELVGVRSRLRSDSLVSLENQNPAIDFSAGREFGIAFRDFKF